MMMTLRLALQNEVMQATLEEFLSVSTYIIGKESRSFPNSKCFKDFFLKIFPYKVFFPNFGK
jgi:hypothetical protein